MRRLMMTQILLYAISACAHGRESPEARRGVLLTKPVPYQPSLELTSVYGAFSDVRSVELVVAGLQEPVPMMKTSNRMWKATFSASQLTDLKVGENCRGKHLKGLVVVHSVSSKGLQDRREVPIDIVIDDKSGV